MKPAPVFFLGVLACAAVIGVSVFATHVVQRRDAFSQSLMRSAEHFRTATPRVSPRAWENLDQYEIDALTKALKGMDKSEVAIFCTRDRDCSDIALDFENALESAGWECGIERALTDTNVGINVAPNNAAGQALAKAIETATTGRLKVGVIDADIGDRLAIVISKKVR